MPSTTNLFLNNIKSNTNSLYQYPTNEYEITTIINNSKPKSSLDSLNLNMKIIKVPTQYVTQSLTHIFNICLLQGHYPGIKKYAIIYPIFKTGDRQNITNYILI